MKSTLYLSDLDGTLLREDETLSTYTIEVINNLVKRGMLFSYATARSAITAGKVTKGLVTNSPHIIYNGAFVVDRKERIIKNVFTRKQASDIFQRINDAKVSPIVYSLIQDKEQFSYEDEPMNRSKMKFLSTRKGDKRERKVLSEKELLDGEVFYFTCIDRKEKLQPLYEYFKDKYQCVFYEEYYTKSMWLEIMSQEASKAKAILQLKKKLGIDQIISFGDSLNDCSMFQISDKCFAVANADERLKRLATEVIGSNNEDGVAHWLEKHVMIQKENN